MVEVAKLSTIIDYTRHNPKEKHVNMVTLFYTICNVTLNNSWSDLHRNGKLKHELNHIKRKASNNNLNTSLFHHSRIVMQNVVYFELFKHFQCTNIFLENKSIRKQFPTGTLPNAKYLCHNHSSRAFHMQKKEITLQVKKKAVSVYVVLEKLTDGKDNQVLHTVTALHVCISEKPQSFLCAVVNYSMS